MSAVAIVGAGCFLRRVGAMLRKELLQLRRDRVTLATMISIPLLQLTLFGYAINTTPRDLPTAVLLQESSDVGRSILAAIQNTKYFKITRQLRDEAELDQALKSGEVLFAVEIPANFERALRRGDDPALLVAADATDPVATGPAIAALSQIVNTALAKDRGLPDAGQPAFEIRAHERYNPAASTPLNIVPGLLGTILTLTMLIFTALSVTRETERGTMESLLAMPITPLEIMLGKIAPYVLVGCAHSGGRRRHVRRADRRQPHRACGADHALHRHQSGLGLHVFDARPEPAAGGADVDDVLSAQHAAFGLRLSVSRHAGLGAVHRRVLAAHAFHPHRACDHAQRRDAVAAPIRHAGACRPYGAGDGDRRDALSPDARLIDGFCCAEHPGNPAF
jgi:hypothetical protein